MTFLTKVQQGFFRVKTCVRFVVVGIFFLSALLAAVPAQGQLRFINETDGGHVVYGQLTNVSSMSQGMGFMLHTVHTHFDERPSVGKFFKTKGSSSVATFFTLSDKNNTHHALTGMVIVSLPPDGKAAAALLYDDTPHFSKSISIMMKHLDEAWAHEGLGDNGTGSGGASASGRAGVAAPLRQTPFPDNSGSIGLPAGWRITGGFQGAIHAEGPDGSQIHYGVTIPVMDPNNPQTRQMIQTETQNGRVPLPGSYVAYPSGGDPARALVSIEAQLSQKQRKPAPTYTITSEKFVFNGNAGSCSRATGTIDRHDNKGMLAAETMICVTQPTSGIWMMTLYQVNARPELKDQEQATLDAIGMSYKANQGVIDNESQAAIGQIHEIGRQADARAAASDQWLKQQDANRASANAAYPSSRSVGGGAEEGQEQHNQDFSNYQRDLSVIVDTDTGEHATTYNAWADALVKADPNKYQYVPTQELMQGVDY
jgi:hypothetical protein